MKAAVFYGIEDIRIEEREIPHIGPDEYLIKVKAAAICGSELRTYLHGHAKIKEPQILGHEFAGEVVEIGENIRGLTVGERVSVHPGIPCGHCYYCDQGYQNLCEERKNISIHYPGAFAEYVKIPGKTLELGTCVKIPENIPYEVAALGDPVVSALNGEEMIDARLGDSILILGCGPIGMLHAMVARLKGASTIILANRSRNRLELAKERNLADYYFCLESDGDLKEFVKKVTGGRGPNKVVVANTSKASAKQGVEVVAKGGLVQLFAGFPKDNPFLDLDGNLIHYNQLTVSSSYGSTPRQFQLAEKLLFEGKIDGASLITHRLPLDEINKGFELMKSGEALKVILTYE
ncbi:alcohol dehydrogenase catalytic domain-containing protein [Anaerocolumna xylanovorans]|uniref:L-iditol 2-dehydrogenase n=1 Tax=Anaerocolumna xylanovorans DSM 12503 TaxID=1121345 RepID=A0A1M7YDB9_9FIRM|nr:alcohol dehydrogenase catalytic domain-containing protein [Anaerocolumna xylanovorans]SHO50634.1 L-iditol 2-dehydrogenase [Anaerocolumna xylanovorans DSM 12503]